MEQKELYNSMYSEGAYKNLYVEDRNVPYHYWMSAAYLYEKHILRPYSNISVVDVGCGIGWFVEALIYIGRLHVMGIDISEVAIQRSRVKQNLVCLDICSVNFPAPNPLFDLAVSIGTFEHILKENLEQAMINTFVLSKRGVFWIDQGPDPTHHTNENPAWWANYIAEVTGLPAIVDYLMTEGGSGTCPVLVNI